MDQIAMCTMNFHNIIASIKAALGRRSEIINHPLDIILIHFFVWDRPWWADGSSWRHDLPWRQAIRRINICERTPIFHRAMTGTFPAGMTKLNCRHRAMRLYHIGEFAIRSDMAWAVEPGTCMGFTTSRFNSGFLAKDNAATTNRQPAKMHQMPVSRRPVNRQILAHWRGDNPVAHMQHTYCHWREQ